MPYFDAPQYSQLWTHVLFFNFVRNAGQRENFPHCGAPGLVPAGEGSPNRIVLSCPVRSTEHHYCTYLLRRRPKIPQCQNTVNNVYMYHRAICHASRRTYVCLPWAMDRILFTAECVVAYYPPSIHQPTVQYVHVCPHNCLFHKSAMQSLGVRVGEQIQSHCKYTTAHFSSGVIKAPTHQGDRRPLVGGHIASHVDAAVGHAPDFSLENNAAFAASAAAAVVPQD